MSQDTGIVREEGRKTRRQGPGAGRHGTGVMGLEVLKIFRMLKKIPMLLVSWLFVGHVLAFLTSQPIFINFFTGGISVKHFFKYYAFTFFLGLTLFLSPIAQAEVTAPIKWSFEFDSCSYSQALEEISQKTGLDIKITRFPEGSIGKKIYKNKSLDYIISDLFRRFNHAVLYYYKEKNLDSVKVVLFEGQGSRQSVKMANARIDRNSAADLVVKTDSDETRRPQYYSRPGRTKSRGQQNKTNDIVDNIHKTNQGPNQSPAKNTNNQSGKYLFTGNKSSPGLIGGGPESLPLSPSAVSKPTTVSSTGAEPGQPVTTPPPYTPPPKPEKRPGLEPPPMPPGMN